MAGNSLFIIKIMKFFELTLTCACVGLHHYSYNSDPDIGTLVTGTFIGYLIIFAGAAIGYFMEAPLHKRINVLFSLVGVVLFVASGAVIINSSTKRNLEPPKTKHEPNFMPDARTMLSAFEIYRYKLDISYLRKNIAKASLAIINGAVLLIDAVLTHRVG